MQTLEMTYNAKNQQVLALKAYEDEVTALSNIIIKPQQARVAVGQFNGQPKSFTSNLATTRVHHLPQVFGGPVLTEVDTNQMCNIALTNAGYRDIIIPGGCKIAGLEEILAGWSLIRLQHFLNAVSALKSGKVTSEKEINEQIKLDVPNELRNMYLELVC